MIKPMPTVRRQNGFEVIIYLNDHPPPHVHVFRAEGEVIIYLGDGETPPQVRENVDMSQRDERRALRLVAEHQNELLVAWRRYHG